MRDATSLFGPILLPLMLSYCFFLLHIMDRFLGRGTSYFALARNCCVSSMALDTYQIVENISRNPQNLNEFLLPLLGQFWPLYVGYICFFFHMVIYTSILPRLERRHDYHIANGSSTTWAALPRVVAAIYISFFVTATMQLRL